MRKQAEGISGFEADGAAGFGRAKASHKSTMIGSEVAYKGRRFDVFAETVLEPSGMKNTREVVRRHGSVAILAVDESRDASDPEVVLERQWRHAPRRFLIELPAGAMEAGETPLAAAQREMMEETGFRAKRWTLLTEYFASPGFVGEAIQIYLARDLQEGVAKPEPDESIEVRMIRLSEAMRMVRSGEIVDGKTMIGLMLFEAKLRDGEFRSSSQS
jgi:ADP-ribose pyrophosphatase